MEPALTVNNIHKSFGIQPNSLEVLRGITFSLNKGEALVVMGPSGSGKSTLLHLIGTLDLPTSGVISLNGQNPFALPENELARFRNEQIGFVFQDHHLLPQFSVLENVLIPTMAFKKRNDEQRKHALDLLERVGLSQRLDHRPAELSGGERQRVAVARALINQPQLLLCDEPTGNLDRTTANQVAQLLLELHRQEQNVMIIVTHSHELAGKFQRRNELNEGVLQAPLSA
jgi:lipoprotein-releasing system ATP-binding protein